MRRSESVNWFRNRRGKQLRRQVEALAERLGRKVEVLDLGGRPDYWANVGIEHVARIEVLNVDPSDFQTPTVPGLPNDLFDSKVGDACDLSAYPDGSVDLVHSNSVIEHVGNWTNMVAMAIEARRVGRTGWVQTPAWSFPIEPHFKAPFVHWFARPMQARLMALSVISELRSADLATRRAHAERINLLSKREFQTLFPDCEILEERIVFAKSYVARW
jgi:hypothetical protein